MDLTTVITLLVSSIIGPLLVVILNHRLELQRQRAKLTPEDPSSRTAIQRVSAPTALQRLKRAAVLIVIGLLAAAVVTVLTDSPSMEESPAAISLLCLTLVGAVYQVSILVIARLWSFFWD